MNNLLLLHKRANRTYLLVGNEPKTSLYIILQTVFPAYRQDSQPERDQKRAGSSYLAGKNIDISLSRKITQLCFHALHVSTRINFDLFVIYLKFVCVKA